MQSTVRFGLFVAGATFAMAALADDSSLIGFWDFKDGADGEAVSTLQNSSGSETFAGTAYRANGQKGTLPVYSSAAPRRRIYTDSTKSTVLVDDPQSIHFAITNDTMGGYIDIAGLSTRLSGESAFTVEFFARMDDASSNPYTVPLCFQTETKHVVATYGAGNGYRFSWAWLNTASPSSGAVSGGTKDMTLLNNWRHTAFVYTETDPASHSGSLKCYLDRELVGEITYNNTPLGQTSMPLRLGTSVGSGRIAHASYCFRGDICALRVTAAALETEEFMFVGGKYEVPEGEMLALVDFAEGTVGEDAAEVVGKGYFSWPGVGYALTDSSRDAGRLPIFCDDAPGNRIYASSVRTDDNVLVDHPKSLKFTTVHADEKTQSEESASVGGGKIVFPTLGTALSYQENYTIECFFKNEDWSNWQWATGLFGFHSYKADGTGFLENQAMVSSVKSGKTTWDVAYDGAKYNKPDTWLDGKWHHLALVYDGTAETMSIYVDHRLGQTVPFKNAKQDSKSEFALGTRTDQRPTYAFRGKVACLRIMPTALHVSEFMRTDTDDLDTVFYWNFENGASRLGQTVLNPTAAAYPTADYTYGWNYQVFGSCTPTYDAFGRKGRIVKWGDRVMGTNNVSLLFHGVQSTTIQDADNIRKYAGTVLRREGSGDASLDQNPTSWTMEAYMRMQYEYDIVRYPGESVMLFAKAGNEKINQSYWDGSKNVKYNWTPSRSWSLCLTKDKQYRLDWTENDGNIDPTTSEAGTGGVDKSKTFPGVSLIYDKKWHHVALTYDAATKSFELFEDGVSLGTAVTGATGPLWDGPFEYEFSRGVGGEGFEGWMDEIRFSRKVLEPKDFIKLERQPSGIFVIVR